MNYPKGLRKKLRSQLGSRTVRRNGTKSRKGTKARPSVLLKKALAASVK